MERLKNIKGAIFDLDGTLLDSLGIWKKIDEEFFARRGLTLPSDYMDAVNVLALPAAAVYTKRRFSLPDRPEDMVEEWRAMSVDAYARDVHLKPFAEAYLLSLKRRNVRLGIATVLHRDCYLASLEHNGILGLFDAITDVTEVARGKGFPDIYLKTAEKMGLEAKDCAVFEDIAPGLRGANLGGFLSVGVYDAHSDYDGDRIRAEAALYVGGYEELLT